MRAETHPAGHPQAAIDPDAAVLARVAAGDTRAFEELVRNHQDRLIGACERLLGNREDARDAAQEVFLRVYRNAASYRPDGKVFTWLYRIAVNYCLNRLRRQKIAQFFSFGALGGDGRGDEAPAFDPPAPGRDAAERLEHRQRWAATRKAIDALPTNQRAVLVLAKFEGLSYREIAEVLGLTVGAVESRLFRAMRRLEAAQEAHDSRVE